MQRIDRTPNRSGAGLVLLLVCGGLWFAGPRTAAGQNPPTALAATLESVAAESTLDITTIGRKSGKPRTKTIWFVYDRGRLYVQSGQDGKTHWYRNLQQTPEMQLAIGALRLTGRAKFVANAEETARVHALFRSKYAFARVAGFVGASIGHGEVVEVEDLQRAAAPQLP